MADKYEVGSDGALTIGNTDYAVTNISYSLDTDVSEEQFNTGMHQTLAPTGASYSGSFEHAGSNEDLRQVVRDDRGIAKVVDQLTVKESERIVIFKHVLVSSRSKDAPSDDRTSETYDFSAEKVTIKQR